MVVVLAGGTGGAKLARGMLDVVGAERLTVVANTGDDIEIYGAHVSPDPDLVSFWLADEIDERGWGLRGDSFAVMDALRQLGAEVWFRLGDRDLAWCLERRRMEDEGLRPTEALRKLCERIGVAASVLPMSDEPLPTWVRTAERGWRPFQKFMIQDRCSGSVEEVEFRAAPAVGRQTSPPGGQAGPHHPTPSPTPEVLAALGGQAPPHDPVAAPTPEVLAALAEADAVIVGPSNPVISIWPILSLIGDALRSLRAPVVCVSPVVAGEVVKGPTAQFMAAYGQPASAAGVAAFYEQVSSGMLWGVVADEPVQGLPTLQIDTLMSDAASRAHVAKRTLEFALSLA